MVVDADEAWIVGEGRPSRIFGLRDDLYSADPDVLQWFDIDLSLVEFIEARRGIPPPGSTTPDENGVEWF